MGRSKTSRWRSEKQCLWFVPYQRCSVSVCQLSEVNVCGLLCSAVLSPLSPSTALLTILQPGVSHFTQFTQHPLTADTTADGLAELPDVVSSVLGVVYDMMQEDGRVCCLLFLSRVNFTKLDLSLHRPQMSLTQTILRFLSGLNRKWATGLQIELYWRVGSSSVTNQESALT